MLLPSLSMVFDGSRPLIKRCDGFDGSLWSTWDEEFTEKSVAHWSEAKLKGSEKKNKNSNNEAAASEHVIEGKAAK